MYTHYFYITIIYIYVHFLLFYILIITLYIDYWIHWKLYTCYYWKKYFVLGFVARINVRS